MFLKHFYVILVVKKVSEIKTKYFQTVPRKLS